MNRSTRPGGSGDGTMRTARAIAARAIAACVAVVCGFTAGVSSAFDAPVAEEPDVVLRVVAPAEIDPLAGPVEISVEIENRGSRPRLGVVSVEGLPEWTSVDEVQQRFGAPPGRALTLPFRFRIDPAAAVDGLYPVHARAAFREGLAGEPPAQLHAVAISRVLASPRVERSPRTVTVAARLEAGIEAATAAFAAAVESAAADPGDADLSARIGACYDDRFLHVVTRVRDDVPAGADRTTPDFRDSDYVRVCVAADPVSRARSGRVGPGDRVCVVAPFAGSDGAPATRWVDYSPATGPVSRPAPDVATAVSMAPDGYRLRVSIPWAVIGAGPSPGRELAFKVIVGDADEGGREREHVLGSWTGDYWRDPGAFELLRLGGESESAAAWDRWKAGCPGSPQPQPDPRIATRWRPPAADPAAALSAAAAAGEAPRDAAGSALSARIGGGDDPFGVAIVPGALGLADGWIAFAGRGTDAPRAVAIRGLPVQLSTGYPGAGAGPRATGPATVESVDDGARIRLPLEDRLGTTFVSWTVRWVPDDGAVEIAVESGRRIVSSRLGSADRPPMRIAAGLGNYMVEPAPFSLVGDGHRLASRFVGVGYETNGIDLVSAVDLPPAVFTVDPDAGDATLVCEGPATWTLVPSTRGLFRAALAYRARTRGIIGAPTAHRVAGRFVVDQWGGHPAAVRAEIERAWPDYGVAGAMLIWHDWQRWGYDYRLPDIHPPNPRIGTVEEFRDLVECCGERYDTFVALHDNYIDIYPDATGFSYDVVGFHGDGRPMAAWYNRGRAAQSYFFRPDRFLPFLQRNIARIADEIGPTAYFVDVFSSRMPCGWYDRRGEYHLPAETRDRWAEAFDVLRECLGGGAPQISESGHDQLIGHLDGAQANHLRVDPADPEWSWPIRCADSIRIPWLDLVWHDRFVLHGAGYPGRYHGILDPVEHGCDSDDYIATEILTGHPGMSPRASGRAAIRHFWLTDAFARGVALASVVDAEFVDEKIRHQRITWSTGGRVAVNRDPSGDWDLGDGRILPPFGWSAVGPGWSTSVTRVDGLIVESARWRDGRRYVNARGTDPDPRHPVWIRRVGFRSGVDGGPAAWEMDLAWTVRGTLPAGYRPFLHLAPVGAERDRDRIAFQAEIDPVADSGEWNGEVPAIARATVPGDVPAGEYRVLVGFWNPDLGRRLWPRNGDSPTRRSACGVITVRRDTDGALLSVSCAADDDAGPPRARPLRFNSERRMVEFGGIRTDGGLLYDPTPPADAAVRIVPLPGEGPFTLEIAPALLAGVAPYTAAVAEGDRPVAVEPLADGGIRVRCGEAVRVLEIRGTPPAAP